MSSEKCYIGEKRTYVGANDIRSDEAVSKSNTLGISGYEAS